MESTAFLLIVLALVIGVGVGWLLGGRGVAVARAERDARESEFKRAISELAVASERVREMPELREALEETTRERDSARLEAVELRTRATEFESRFAEFKADREVMASQFRDLGAKVLDSAQESFLKRAQERFGQAGEANEAKMKALLAPVETTLKRYEEGLAKVERDRVDSYAGLREQIENVRVGQGQVREETARLVNALRTSPKARGRWGEQSLRNVLEQAGLSPFADFQQEVVVATDDGVLRPDVIVRLPGGRKLVIDAKCSLNAFLDASDATDDEGRAAGLRAHAASVRTHAQQLGSKSYWDKFGDAADYVVMYIPGEHFLFAALEQDPRLWEWAIERRVLLATPTNLVAIAKTIANIWRQEKLIDDARAVDALGKELHERLATAATHLKRVGGGLNSAVENYNKFVSSFEGRVLVSARRFRDLSVGTGAKEIDSVDTVDALAKPTVGDVALLPAAEAAEAAAE
ncbi:DNA recombination protein RmuC [Sphingomonas donggukensis]|uniref:DNA recombination protein RmuC homolog n=1 Tax=Sphingomonas donggukensis TaxID=2949093 RepID=A0ABY4U119_9SPHN|nr:DNA recombination protein RmuC [Sphingomonas donggukensis]URW76476.1 DNA recombination protein RmuC [Sphingomonas donggukensis]